MFFLLLLSSLFFFTGHSSFAAETLSLPLALERASQNNPHLLSAQKELSIAKTQISQAKSLFYPKLNLNMDYIRYRHETIGVTPDDMGNVVLEAPLPQSNGERNNPLASNLYVGRFDVKQTLFAGGKLNYTFRRSQANLRRAESALESLKGDVAFNTTQNFLKVLAFRQQLLEWETGQKKLVRLEEGSSSSKGSAFAVRRARGQVERRLASLVRDERKAELDMLDAMGVEFSGGLVLEGTLGAPVVSTNFETLLAWAKQNRSELRENQLQEEVDQLSVDLSMAERYPVFLLGGSYEVRNNDFPLTNSNWNAGLIMNIPLFDGFSSLARVRESRYRRDQSKLTRVQLEDQIDKEVRSAFDEFNMWKEEAAKAKEDVAWVDAQKKTNEQDVDFLLWSLESRDRGVETLLQMNLSKARLEHAVGRRVN